MCELKKKEKHSQIPVAQAATVKTHQRPGVLAHTCNPSTQEAEEDRWASLGNTAGIPGQPELYDETLSQKQINNLKIH